MLKLDNTFKHLSEQTQRKMYAYDTGIAASEVKL